MILDTNAVSALLAGDAALGEALADSDRHHLPLPVSAEYQFGVLVSKRRRRLESLFRRLEAKSFVLAPDRETANIDAAVRHDLRKRGTPIPEHDLWVAALARQDAVETVSRDLHFDAVAGVNRIGW